MFSSILLGAALVGHAAAVVNGANQEPLPTIPGQSFGDDDKFPTTDGKCQSGLYIAKEIPTHLYEVDSEDEHTFTKLHSCGSDSAHPGYNAIGYNVNDNFIYGVSRGAHESGDGAGTDAHTVIRINKDGCTEDVVQLPPNDGHNSGRHISADVHGGFLWAGRGDTFRQVALQTINGLHGWVEYKFSTCVNLNDFAFAGSTWATDSEGVTYGDAFGWDVVENQFCKFSASQALGEGTRETLLGDFGLLGEVGAANLRIGAFFMDRDGGVYMYDNDLNTLFKIGGFAGAIANGTPVTVEWAKVLTDAGGDPEDNNVDGASCADSPGAFGCPSLDKRCCPFE